MVRSSGEIPRVQWGAGEIGGPRHEYRESLIMGLIKNGLTRGGAVLDAGCGSGSILFKMSDIGCMAYGIEQSKEYVEILRKKIKKSGAGDVVHIKYGSVIDIPYPGKSFDAVVCGDVLEHVMDDTKAITEIYRVLKPGGFCVISVPAFPALWDITDEWAGHLRRYTREGLVSLFEKKGFLVEDARFWGFPFVILYHRLAFLPYMKKKVLRGGCEDARKLPDAGRHQGMTKLFSLIFKFDSLFRWIPFGIGLVLKARKPGTVVDLKLSTKLGAIGCTS